MSKAVLNQLVDTVKAATADQRPLCIRGSGSKDGRGGPPVGEVLDVRPLCGISSYEPTELVITARAGTPLPELEAALAERQQYLAFEPPRFGGGTVGGMVAAGLAGPARASVGSVRDYVLGATLLNGRGEVMSFGGQVMKNVAGYDVSRVLAGSMGVLGVICEVSLKVLPLPPASLTLRFDMDQTSALRHLNQWAGDPLPLNASVWWDDTLVLRLRGAAAAVTSAARRLGGEPIAEDLAAPFWNGLREQTDDFFATARDAVRAQGASLWRLSVAPSAPRVSLGGEHLIDQLVEWGGGQRWLLTTASATAVHEAAQDARGHAQRWWGGDGGADGFAPLSAPLLRIHRELKRAFDPAGIFNRQRLHPEL
ncbi:glycolate oxidase subunit GlcE [Ideonella sp.]|jgi:glycolate oxidase FAD binding subunit|uniref:glycolate oxidase subunit GlcE n=1 Tax=Ideonella sp. TaxID=1929293 RepID=UPI0037BE5DE0